MTTPTLHDDRIDKMRLNVMHRVGQDVQRRGRRTRQTLGLTAASVLVVGLGGYGLSLVSSPGMSSGDSGGSSSIAADSGSSAADTPARPETSRQVITTGSVSVVVKSPRDTAQRLSTWVESIGGRIDDRSESGTGDDASASVTVRVPSNRVTATIDRLKTYGTVEDVAVQNTDVTADAKDLDARIDALQLSIDRLQQIMTGAGTSAEVIKAEAALTQRQEQLESLQAQRKGLADQVSLSTLTIDLSQKAPVGSVEPGGFTGGLRDGWGALISTVNVIVEVAGVLLPWAVIVGALVGAGALVSRLRPTSRRRPRSPSS
jgi:hypothetical protein